MKQRFNVKRFSLKERKKYDCEIIYNKRQNNVQLLVSDSEFGELKFEGNDMLDALKLAREYYEQKKSLLLCAGSMPNVHSSGMLRDRTNGEKAYILTYGEEVSPKDIIHILSPASEEEVGTIEEQEEYIEKINEYFRRKNQLVITEQMELEAKNNPNGWVYKIDADYDLSVDVPPEAIVGAWKVDKDGYILKDSFVFNENYIPKK